LGIINFLAWITLILQFRIFEKLRIFIRLITEVVFDLRIFFIVLIASIFTFATTYVVLSHNPTN